MQTNKPLLIIITGPVGAGKSTTSLALARSLRRPDFDVAAIDLDQMYGFVRQQDGYGEPSAWARARAGAAALANALFDTGISVVIVEGEFFNAEELGTLKSPTHAGVALCFFTLRLSYERALERVQGDPSRGASKDPSFLKGLHTHFAQALPFLEAESVVIDTDDLTQDEVVARLVHVIGEQLRHPTR
ncbi:MAG TPA: zeta toxin family protein [Roseiflexaceae bacterium]|nr:zeta toxin family protein [Roseiflexaceae bacterium]